MSKNGRMLKRWVLFIYFVAKALEWMRKAFDFIYLIQSCFWLQQDSVYEKKCAAVLELISQSLKVRILSC